MAISTLVYRVSSDDQCGAAVPSRWLFHLYPGLLALRQRILKGVHLPRHGSTALLVCNPDPDDIDCVWSEEGGPGMDATSGPEPPLLVVWLHMCVRIFLSRRRAHLHQSQSRRRSQILNQNTVLVTGEMELMGFVYVTSVAPDQIAHSCSLITIYVARYNHDGCFIGGMANSTDPDARSDPDLHWSQNSKSPFFQSQPHFNGHMVLSLSWAPLQSQPRQNSHTLNLSE